MFWVTVRVKFLGSFFLCSLTPLVAPACAQSTTFLPDATVVEAQVDAGLTGPLSRTVAELRLEEDPFLSEISTVESPARSVEGVLSKPESDALPNAALAEPMIAVANPPAGFGWRPAIAQSLRMLAFQQGIMLATDKWSRYCVMHGKFFHDYAAAVSGGLRQWDDGDPFLDNYIGHPLQGAVTGFIQVQNDPRGRALTIGKSKAYWKSRLKAMGWTALYSTQFEIGPISESSIQNLGSFSYQNCDTCPLTRGAGWVDIVVTPTLGTAWLIGEDALDQYVIRRIENKLGRGKWTNFFRSVLNPARVAANALRLKAPWYRDNRDDRGAEFEPR